MLKKFQMNQMIDLQNKLNSRIDPNWIDADHNWFLAGSLELAECIDHIGWKWWKKQSPNIPMAQNEIIDYWHFLLSDHIAAGDTYYAWPHSEESGTINFDDNLVSVDSLNVIEKIFLLIGLSSAKKTDLYLLDSIMSDLGLSWDELYKQYIAKNILNIFRQDNGYADGTYKKIWFDGREDNCHMLDIMEEYDSIFHTEDFLSAIENGLAYHYSK